MNPLPYPDRWHLDFAKGWLMLGNFQEAIHDLDRVPAHCATHPEVQEVRCRLLIEQKKWQSALDVLADEMLSAPENAMKWVYFGYCLHELGQTAIAARVLETGSRRFPRHQLLHHNLACYLHQLGRRTEALRCVNRALRIRQRAQSF